MNGQHTQTTKQQTAVPLEKATLPDDDTDNNIPLKKPVEQHTDCPVKAATPANGTHDTTTKQPLLHPFPMALMPLSQATAWYMILHSPTTEIYSVVSAVAGFYTLWALYLRYCSYAPKEIGHFTMGFLCAASALEHRNLCIAASMLVLANFGLATYFVFFWSPSKLARVVKKSGSSTAITWAYVFKLYFMSSIYLWSVVLKKFMRYEELLEKEQEAMR